MSVKRIYFVCVRNNWLILSLSWHVIFSRVQYHHHCQKEQGVPDDIANIRRENTAMTKVSRFFRDCWSEYVDFMGKYGEYMLRQ